MLKFLSLIFISLLIFGCREVDDLEPNNPPQAYSGNDLSVELGSKVIVDGSGSSDPDNDSLYFNWILTSKPLGSNAVILYLDSVKNEFVADVPGTYTLKLIVSDGISSSTDFIVITAVYKPKLKVSTLANANGAFYGTIGPDGNIYVSGYSTHVIYKVTTTGVVSTYAGTGVAGYLNDKSPNAQFKNPAGLVFDATGNLYVVDYGNHCIRRISTSAVVTTFAGFPQAGYADATGEKAQFSEPISIVRDSKGNFFVSEMGNLRIRKVTSAAVVTTFAGNGKPGLTDTVGLLSQFRAPVNMAIDATDNIYVADATNHCIRKINPQAQVTTFAGTGISGFANRPSISARFSNPFGVATGPSGAVYVADYTNNRIRIIQNNQVSTYAGNGTLGFVNGEALLASFQNPTGLVVNAPGSIVYVMDYVNNAIRKIQVE